MVSLTKILVGICFMSLLVGGIFTFIQGGVNTYAPTGYENTSLVLLKEKFNDIQNITNQTRVKLDTIKETDGITDVIGLYLGKSFAAAKLTLSVFDTTNEIIDIGVDELYGTSDYAINMKTVLPTIVLLVLLIGILLHILTKSDRL